MAEHSVGFRVTSDITDFERGMAGAVRTAQQAGNSIGKAFDGKAVATALFAGLGFSLTGMMQQIANSIARLWTGFSENAEAALNAVVALTGKAADTQEKKLAEARKRIDAQDAESARAAEKTADVVREARIKNYEDEREAGRKLTKDRREQEAELSRLDNEAAEARMSKAEKLTDWLKQDAVAVKEIAQLEALGNKRSIEETNTLIELKTAHADLQDKIKTAVVGTAKAEAKVTEEVARQNNELQKQQDFRDSLSEAATERTILIGGKAYGKSRDPEAIKRAGDAELKELIRRQKGEIGNVEGQKGLGETALSDAATNFLLHGIVIARLQTDIQRATKELDMRNGLRASVAFGGVEGARSKFAGDPLAFDRLVQQYVDDARDLKKINAESNELLRQMNQKMKTGLPVVNLNTGGG